MTEAEYWQRKFIYAYTEARDAFIIHRVSQEQIEKLEKIYGDGIMVLTKTSDSDIDKSTHSVAASIYRHSHSMIISVLMDYYASNMEEKWIKDLIDKIKSYDPNHKMRVEELYGLRKSNRSSYTKTERTKKGDKRS